MDDEELVSHREIMALIKNDINFAIQNMTEM
jgi:hypothetical protein